jgi:acetylornithine deacetylase/succinyl-diaminopimelate desuccinylase-like protein
MEPIMINPDQNMQQVFHTHSTGSSVISDLKTFLRFPTISSDSSKREALQQCARWLAGYLRKAGLPEARIYQTRLHPIVYGEHIADPSYKTILFYGHYDVQPVEPVKKWTYPPFDPVIRDNHIYARGASDDKGQLFVHIKAIEYVMKNQDQFRVNIKCLLEGEEEIGSPNLPAFINSYKEMIRCDAVVVSDTRMLSAERPALTYSLRGSLNAEVHIGGQSKDLHSGTFGGLIHNPADIAAQLVSNINNNNGQIMIPGFYENVRTPDEKERAFMKQSGPSDSYLLRDAGATRSWGEKNYTNYERVTVRPSVVVSTIQSGHPGEGVKNVIPSSAVFKVNMRLVKGQRPRQIGKLFETFIQRQMPPGFKYQIKYSSMVDAVEINRNNPYLRAAAQAYATAFGQAPVFLRNGGTIPVVSLFNNELNIPVVLMGFALGSDNMHAPDEKFYLPTLYRGIKTSIEFMKNMSTR